MLATLDAFWQKASLYMNLPKISITDIVEIIIIAFLIYYMLVWIKNTRAWMLLRGLMVILLFVLLAALFQMNTIIWIARNTLNVLVIALVAVSYTHLDVYKRQDGGDLPPSVSSSLPRQCLG